MQITVVGMGYVGTVAAACLADSGNDVAVVDINPTKITQLNTGQSPVMEFGLAELLTQNVERGRLSATDDLQHCFRTVRPPSSASVRRVGRLATSG